MKLKDKNDVMQEAIEGSLKELSQVFGTVHKINSFFSYWTNMKFLDKDKNLCVRGVMDFGVTDDKGKVISFKKLIDRALVLRENIGTLEVPKYGKQLGYEELRRKMLSEIIGKSIAGLAMTLVEQTAEQIEEFNKLVPQEDDREI